MANEIDHGSPPTPEEEQRAFEAQQAIEAARQAEEARERLAAAARQRDAAVREREAAAREREAAAREREVAARERKAAAAEAAQLKKERARLAEEAEATEEQAGDAQVLAEAQKEARAIKELKAVIDKHRRALRRGKYLWHTLFLLFLHLIILSIAAAFFMWTSEVLHASPPPLAEEYRKDIIRVLIITAIISLPLLFEYWRNWQNYKYGLSRLDKISVDMTEPYVDLFNIRTRLNKILDDQNKFFFDSSEEPKSSP